MKFFFLVIACAAIWTGTEVRAGGVICKQCPSESDVCIPRGNCAWAPRPQPPDDDIETGRCPANSVDNCQGYHVGTSCQPDPIFHSNVGTCSLTPLTAGGFCMCYPNKTESL